MADVIITKSLALTDDQVVLGVVDNPVAGLEVSGTWTGTLNIESNVDPDNPVWAAAQVFTSAGVGAASTMTANGRRLIQAVGVGQIRGRFNPASSGIAVVTLRAGDGSLGSGGGGGGGGGAVTEADGANVALGTTTDAGIITNIAGTVIGFLRGSIIQWAAFLARFPAALVSGRLDVNLGAAPAVVATQGNVANASADSGNPVKIGRRAVAFGTNPTPVAAADRVDALATRGGLDLTLPGHPNTITFAQQFTTAQTNQPLVSVATGTKIIVTGFLITANNANTVNVSAVLGFGTATVPGTGNAGIIGAHGGIAPGSGFGQGAGGAIVGAGADDEDVRLTSGVPTGGDIWVTIKYFTTPS
jgi:hypothetical protein